MYVCVRYSVEGEKNVAKKMPFTGDKQAVEARCRELNAIARRERIEVFFGCELLLN